MKPELLLWANYRRITSSTTYLAVPSPYSDGTDVPYWYDKIAAMASIWASMGITKILLGNPVMGNGGQAPTMDGYSPYNDYDLGQSGPTRFGTLDQLRRCIAILHAWGIEVLLDIVLHQRMGGNAGVYEYTASAGPKTGRFPKQPSYFRGPPIPPRVPQDPVPDSPDDYEFGDELCPVNALPKGIVWKELLHAGDYLFRITGADGARLDDMKGINVGFMTEFCRTSAMAGKWFFGEYADGNPNNLNWYESQCDGCMSLFDFAMHYGALEPMCNDANTFNMATIGWQGLIASNPMKAVPFVESMDSDTDGFATVVDDKAFGYALLLTGQGLPCVFIKDYLAEPYCYGLDIPIKNLCWIHTVLISGDSITRYSDEKTYVFERTGGPRAIVGLNNDIWNPAWKTVTVQTGYEPGVLLHDYTGRNGQDMYVQSDGSVTFGIPPGENGNGYVVFSRAGLSGPVPELPAIQTVQEFEGASDLIQPALTNAIQLIGRIWCAAETAIALTMFDHDGSAPNFQYAMEIDGPKGETIENGDKTINDGWHLIYANGIGLAGSTSFRLQVRYTATKTLVPSQY